MPLTAEQLAAYRRDGFVVVPGIFSAEEIDRALAAADRINYGKPYAEWAAAVTPDTAPIPVVHAADEKDKDGARSQFPTGVPALDQLVANDDYLDAVEQLLGTCDAQFSNGTLWVRTGFNEKPGGGNPRDGFYSGFHIDHGLYSVLPPGDETEEYDCLATDILLHDIHPDGAPIVMLPGSHIEMTRNPGSTTQWAEWLVDVRKHPSFDLGKLKFTTGSKGSVLFYSTYLMHAAQPFKNKTLQRSLLGMVAARQSTAQWNGLHNFLFNSERKRFNSFWDTTTARARSFFGWPKPGHRYYTRQTLKLLQEKFPKMDLQPYYAALAS